MKDLQIILVQKFIILFLLHVFDHAIYVLTVTSPPFMIMLLKLPQSKWRYNDLIEQCGGHVFFPNILKRDQGPVLGVYL